MYHYICLSKEEVIIELFNDVTDAWKTAACFLRLRISDVEYFGKATQEDYHISNLLEQEKIEEACAIFNHMQGDEKLEVFERLVN